MLLVRLEAHCRGPETLQPAVDRGQRPDECGKSDAARKNGIEQGRKVLELVMQTRGTSTFIAGDLSLADLYLAPIAFYLSLTPDKDAVFDVAGFDDWWTRIQSLPSYQSTQPNLG